ncbi:hypothetical protein NKR23_g10752 [Pleurostoma richardsiae]|uniref:Ubiquitin 3 binding protein But2 C-terminal domain-containing protein n=1 Tax=Pleurostoma richardsiae TaxID=41990 RepID=A0AA38RBW2_9PEZI|nr:hypothetical protein NKR23_g10752 [Pleurostoma richardsiae]
MAKGALFVGIASLLALGASAAPSCNGSTILAPYQMITFDLSRPDAPGWDTSPSFEVALNADLTTGYSQLLRFAPPSSGTCTWVLNLPADRFDSEVQQGKPANGGNVSPTWAGVPRAAYEPSDTLADVQAVKLGQFGANNIQVGSQNIHSDPCASIPDVLVEIPAYLQEAQWAYWRQDIRPNDEANSLGVYLKVSC